MDLTEDLKKKTIELSAKQLKQLSHYKYTINILEHLSKATCDAF